MSNYRPDFHSPIVALEDGRAYRMGDGLVIIDQDDESVLDCRLTAQRVVLTQADLTAMQRSCGPSLGLDDGSAEYVGDGIWIVFQRDEMAGVTQSVVLNDNDRARLLAA